MTEISPGIVVDHTIRFGKPVIQGTRVPVDTIVARVASGLTVAKVADEYGIEEADVYNALRYAALRLSEEEVWATT